MPDAAEEAAHGPSTTASADAEAAEHDAELEERAAEAEGVRSELAAVQAELAAARRGAGEAAEAAAGEPRFVAMWQVKYQDTMQLYAASTCFNDTQARSMLP